MKPGKAGLWVLLLATHAAVFLAARPAGSSATGAGQGAAPAAQSAVAGAVPAKAGLREAGGGRAKPSSIHSGRLVELNASDLKGEEYEEAVLAIFREWIKRDLRGALLAMHGVDAGSRYFQAGRMLRDEVKHEMLAQSRQVEQWIIGMEFGSRHHEVGELWAQALVEAGRREELMAVLPDLPKRTRVLAIDELCETAKAPELARLRQWMEPNSQEGLDDYSQRVLRFAGADVEQVFLNEQDPEVRQALAEAYAERHISNHPPLEALAAARKLPAEYRAEALVDIAGSAGLSGFTSVLAEMDRLGMWEEITPEQEETLIQSAIESTCDGYSLPDDVFRELSGIARPGTRLAALRQAASEMGSPGLAAHALEDLPRGAELDAFIEGMVGDGESIQPETWPLLLAPVSDAGLKERLRAMVQVEELLEEGEGG